MLALIVLLATIADDPARALTARMQEIAALNGRLRRVADLVAQERWTEARVAAAELPSAVNLGRGHPLRLPGSCRPAQDYPSCIANRAKWMFTYAGQPDLSVSHYEKALAVGWTPRQPDDPVDIYYAYVEAGQYDKALTQASVIAPGRSWIASGIPELEMMASRPGTVLEQLERLERGFQSRCPLARLLALWGYAPRTPQERFSRLRLMKAAYYLTDVRALASHALAEDPALSIEEAALELTDLASEAAGRGQLEDGVAYLKRLLRRKPPRALRARAMLGIGGLLRRLGRYTEAADALEATVAMDEESTADAAWELAHALLGRGDASAALAAYGRARQYPFPDCWNSGRSEATFHLYAGLCLERMGRRREAVEHYLQARVTFPTSWRVTLAGHLVDLYASASQLDVLEAMPGLARDADKVHFDFHGDGRRPGDLVFRDALELRRAEQAGDWEVLLSVLTSLRPDGSLDLMRRSLSWPAREAEAARLLARHPELSLRLRQSLGRGPENRAPVWLYYALGLMATPDALEALVEEAGREPRLHVQHLKSLLWAMGLTPAGRAVRQTLVERDDLLARVNEYTFLGPARLDRADLEAEFDFVEAGPVVELPRELPRAVDDPPPPLRRARTRGCEGG